jgi:hypothetical protein
MLIFLEKHQNATGELVVVTECRSLCKTLKERCGELTAFARLDWILLLLVAAKAPVLSSVPKVARQVVLWKYSELDNLLLFFEIRQIKEIAVLVYDYLWITVFDQFLCWLIGTLIFGFDNSLVVYIFGFLRQKFGSAKQFQRCLTFNLPLDLPNKSC